MTDHKAEAERLANLEIQDIAGMTVDEIIVSTTAALVNATLYHAEQQRVANLIAIWAVPELKTEIENHVWDLIRAAIPALPPITANTKNGEEN
jgi:TPP-dependent trihydroxycyclohexane-1,2-dione (THcHDO) dehydratase